MARLDWSAHRNRKRPGWLISAEEKRANKRKARALAQRLGKGYKSPTAYLHGPVRSWSLGEIEAWAAEHGFGVVDRNAPPW